MKISKRKIGRYVYEISLNNQVIGRAENQLDYWEAYTRNFDDFRKCSTLKESVDFIVKKSSIV